ncbi:tetratricopeptide repeat protein [Acinetobacter gyllenbergii]|uniref:tetratricopeptide repeat protein n=1 Tax=Acinetobacter gyllenbergii TaxID=134534 RepID=UPI0021CE0837|nr:tetratricopeptide repeat protein [Acinetobacter gyllenbergii]
MNDVDAMGSIGSIYIEEGNTEEGLIYLKRAAEKNDALSLFELGLIYCDGVVVKKDYKLCNDCWEKSALLNNAEAALNLGINLMNGKGVLKDVDRAIKYFEIASKLSKGQASYNLGVIYSSPNYNKLNESLSQFYFNKAYEQGISNAKEKIKQ